MDVSVDTRSFAFALKLLGGILAVAFLLYQSAYFALTAVADIAAKKRAIQRSIASLEMRRTHASIMLAAAAVSPPIEVRNVRLAFAGDIMLDRGVKRVIDEYGGGDFRYPFLRIGDKLRAYDLLFANLEGPISERGRDQENGYSFRMDPQAMDGLIFAGFDVVSVANNHIGDWGAEAASDTFRRLAGVGIEYAGGGMDWDEAMDPRIISLGGLRVAYLAFAESLGGYASNDGTPVIAVIEEEAIRRSTARAAELADIVVVSFHFGEEYAADPNSFQERMALLAIDSGADLVVGHHPHVVQPMERYKNAYIAYSLGNFVFDQDFSDETMRGMLLEVEIGAKAITGLRIREIRINPQFQPEFITP